tara:strand:+ start:1261 stop:1914 length:654 start_codon:yes stop_codon:yes gene_type:complete
MILNSLEIIPSKKNNVLYMPSINWIKGLTLPENNKDGIVVSNNYLVSSIKNKKFSIKNLILTTEIEIKKDNEKDLYSKVELRTITFNNNINILLQNKSFDVEIDYNNDKQEFEFVNFEEDLFEIIDTSRDQSFYVIFQLIADNMHTKQIFIRFEYKPSKNIGDVNGDGIIDLRDLVALSDHILQGKAIDRPDFADINKDRIVDKYDVIDLSRKILNG